MPLFEVWSVARRIGNHAWRIIERQPYMATINNLNPETLLAPFAKAIGKQFPKVVADAKSFLGRLEKDIITKNGDWKVSTKGRIVAKDGHTLQLPLNSPMSSLIMFGMRLAEVSGGGKFSVNEATLPEVCQAWIAVNYSEVPASTPASK